MYILGLTWKRYVGFLLAMFVTWFSVSLLLYTLYAATASPWVLIATQIQSPLVLLLFSWLYFRKVKRNDWTVRFVVAVTWLVLLWLLAAPAMYVVYGSPLTYVFSWVIFKAQGFNFTALLVGAYLAHQESTEKREVLEPTVDEVFRP